VASPVIVVSGDRAPDGRPHSPPPLLTHEEHVVDRAVATRCFLRTLRPITARLRPIENIALVGDDVPVTVTTAPAIRILFVAGNPHPTPTKSGDGQGS
jgi:hypothetical protein